MGAIVVGLRPDDYRQLHQLAEAKGRRPQDLAGIYLEQAIRRAKAPALHQAHSRLTATDSREPEAVAR